MSRRGRPRRRGAPPGEHAVPARAHPAPPLVELSIDSLAAGGDGVGRGPDGRVVFVPFTAPGDRVRVRIEADHGRFLRGSVATLLAPGAARTDPLCSVFGTCGGCAWQHVAYAAQIEAKRAIVRDALARIGSLEAPEGVGFVASPSPYGYRSRARLVAQAGRVGFRRRRSHALCAVTRCPILVPALDGALEALAAQPPREDGEIELAAGEDGTVRAASLPSHGSDARIALRIGPDRLEISPGGFAQANALLFDALAGALHAAAGEGALVLELFAGAGFFTLGLARRFERVVAVESDPQATRDLAANLRTASLENVEVVALPVEEALERPPVASLRPDVVVLDPPRAGLPPGAADTLVRRAPRRVVSLSCDPATHARDLGLLADAGYRLASVTAFDLFPQTPHVETLAVMEREDA